MKRRVNHVRRRIAKRRKNRKAIFTSENTKDYSYVNLEEKHGYLPPIHPSTSKKSYGSKKTNPFTKVVAQVMLSVGLFLFVKIMLLPNTFFPETLKNQTLEALTEDFPFAKVYSWYEESFGEPLSLTNRVSQKIDGENLEEPIVLPVNGQVSPSTVEQFPGIFIRPEEAENVRAMLDGFVIFSGRDRDTNHKTIIIQHKDNSKTIYGNLNSVNVHLYQFVPKNKVIGSVDPTTANGDFYFSIEKDRKPIDPLQVIKLENNE